MQYQCKQGEEEDAIQAAFGNLGMNQYNFIPHSTEGCFERPIVCASLTETEENIIIHEYIISDDED
jgi:hypothetical protein